MRLSPLLVHGLLYLFIYYIIYHIIYFRYRRPWLVSKLVIKRKNPGAVEKENGRIDVNLERRKKKNYRALPPVADEEYLTRPVRCKQTHISGLNLQPGMKLHGTNTTKLAKYESIRLS